MENNQVEHPNHYNKGNIECFDVIKAYIMAMMSLSIFASATF